MSLSILSRKTRCNNSYLRYYRVIFIKVAANDVCKRNSCFSLVYMMFSVFIIAGFITSGTVDNFSDLWAVSDCSS